MFTGGGVIVRLCRFFVTLRKALVSYLESAISFNKKIFFMSRLLSSYKLHTFIVEKYFTFIRF